MKEVPKTRKCSICKKNIITSDERYIMRGNKSRTFSHYDCFVNMKKNSNRKISEEEIKKQAKEYYIKAQQYEMELIAKDRLNTFLSEQYDVVMFSNRHYEFMESIFQGTHKKINQAIPPSVLLEMWTSKIGYLKKQQRNRDAIGRVIRGEPLIKWDMTVLANQVGKFYKWKANQQELIENDTQNTKNDNNKTTINNQQMFKNMSKEKQNELDIDSILDEI